ncbi:MAG: hypothetical protein LGB62_07990, partial [Sulfurovum sp.]|nr:hypothetical protein [Sulfurovum sp.]
DHLRLEWYFAVALYLGNAYLPSKKIMSAAEARGIPIRVCMVKLHFMEQIEQMKRATARNYELNK